MNIQLFVGQVLTLSILESTSEEGFKLSLVYDIVEVGRVVLVGKTLIVLGNVS